MKSSENMSRHRNVRSMDYSEEYEGFDDIYGHSVEDDHCISPSDAGFIYDRSRYPQMSAFFHEDNYISEENEQSHIERKKCQKSDLTETEINKLKICMDEIQNVIGDMVPQSIIEEIAISCNFDVKISLDHILNEAEVKKFSVDEESDLQIEKKSGNEMKGLKAVETMGPMKGDPEQFTELCASEEKTDVPSITIISTGMQTIGFDVGESATKSSNLNYPRYQTPISGRNTPTDIEDSELKNSNIEKGNERAIIPNPYRENRENRVDAEKLYISERSQTKQVLHMVVIGHVDAGKSTLMGHLLYSLGQINKRTMHKYEKESKKIGKQSFVYAWILDETGEERSRGITMDVGQSKFETKTKLVNLLDAPGHKDFIPNMIIGATQADVAVLVVDATRGEFETGFESGGQTREHALLVRSLGVSQLAVVVNKLDTVGWSEERFKEIIQKLGAFLKQAGFRDSDVTYVPCSGLAGENLIEKPSQDQLKSWYTGPCLLEVIDNFKVPERPIKKPLRVSVNDIYKSTGSGFCVTGRVETGVVQSGDKVLVLPPSEIVIVKSICIDDAPVQTAFAGDCVSLTLANYDMQNINIGYILCDPNNPVPVTIKFEGRIVVFNIDIPITTGYPVILHVQSLAQQAVVTKLIAQLHKSSGEIIKKRPRCLTKNSNAIVEIETTRTICLELYREIKELGRFMLRVDGISIAAGLVTKIF